MKPIKTQFKPVEPTGLGFCTTLHTKEPFKNLHRVGVNNATLILVLNPSVGCSHCIVGLQLSKKYLWWWNLFLQLLLPRQIFMLNETSNWGFKMVVFSSKLDFNLSLVTLIGLLNYKPTSTLSHKMFYWQSSFGFVNDKISHSFIQHSHSQMQTRLLTQPRNWRTVVPYKLHCHSVVVFNFLSIPIRMLNLKIGPLRAKLALVLGFKFPPLWKY